MFVDQTVYHGRAEDTNRLDKELRCYDLLDRLGLSYDRVDHDAADTIEACAAVEQVLGAGICKNLFLTNRQQTAFYLLLMPGHKPFRTKDLSHQIGSARLSCINTSTLKLRMTDAVDVLIPALAHAPTYVDLPVYAPET